MLESSLFRRFFFLVTILVLSATTILYFIAVPLIKDKVYTLEENSARTILDNVYEIARVQAHTIESYERDALESYKRQLKNIVLVGESYIRHKHELVQQGRMTKDQAIQDIIKEISSVRYGNNDYLMIADYDGVILAHPDPEVRGTDFTGINDIYGNPIVSPLIEGAQEYGEVYSSYWWKRLEEENPSEKLVYSLNFPEWGWVICSGLYVDDVAKTVAEKLSLAREEFRTFLQDVVIAQTGYVYVFTSDYDMIIHPNPDIEKKNIRNLLNPSTGNPILDDLMEAATTEEAELHYLWDRTQDSGNYIYPKISWVRYLEEMDWYIASSVYIDELNESAEHLRQTILWIFGGLVIGALIIAYVAARRMLVPIRNLTSTAAKVKAGELSARCPVKGTRDEIVLAEVFNSSLDQLQELVEHLMEERERAQEANEAKSLFLANMSHEIRTPLNAIIGLTELAGRTRLTPRQSDYLWKTNAAAKTLLGLVNDILDFSRVESGHIQLDQVEFRLNDVLTSLATLMGAKLEGKDLDIAMSVPQGMPQRMKGDPLRISQVLANLGSNAVKFTETGEILVTVKYEQTSSEEGVLSFTFTDTGIGMAKEKLESVFQAFNQADASISRKFGGTGLGLTISKRLAVLMDGDLTVESTLGQGSTFTFSTPVGFVPDEQDLQVCMADNLEGMLALIISGHDMTRQVLADNLLRICLVPYCAENLEHAREIISGLDSFSAFGLILADLASLKLDPVDMAEAIRDLGKHPKAPKLIFLTTTAQGHALDRMEKARVDGNLIKPFSPQTLFGSISQAFNLEGPRPGWRQHFGSNRVTLRGMQVLVAEDNLLNQQVIKELLQEEGIHVTVAENGAKAIELAEEYRFDLVLMDIQMPEMDGFQATKRIRELKGYEETPILAMTAHALSGDREKSLQHGLDDHLTKPIDQEQLFTALIKWRPERPMTNTDEPPLGPVIDGVQLPYLESIDYEVANRRFGKKPERLLRNLPLFLQQHQNDIAKLQAFLEQEQLEDARNMVHGLKGGSSMAGYTALYERSQELERALNAKDMELVDTLLPGFTAEFKTVFDSLARAFASSP